MRISDWSSDVCSSDLEAQPIGFARKHRNLAERLQSGGIRIEAKQRELAVRGIGAVARDDQNPPLTADRDIATQIDIVDPPRIDVAALGSVETLPVKSSPLLGRAHTACLRLVGLPPHPR